MLQRLPDRFPAIQEALFTTDTNGERQVVEDCAGDECSGLSQLLDFDENSNTLLRRNELSARSSEKVYRFD